MELFRILFAIFTRRLGRFGVGGGGFLKKIIFIRLFIYRFIYAISLLFPHLHYSLSREWHRNLKKKKKKKFWMKNLQKKKKQKREYGSQNQK